MFGGNPLGGGFGELASDFAINSLVPGGLNSPMGMIADNLIGGNPNGGFGMGGGMGGPYGGGGFNGGMGGGMGGPYGGGGFNGGMGGGMGGPYGGGGFNGRGYGGGYGGGYGY